MDELVKKLDEFNALLKNAILEKKVPLEIKSSISYGYNGEISLKIKKQKICITVGDNIICYHNDFMADIFDENDRIKLNEFIKEHKRNATKNKIKELENEIEELKGLLEE